MEGPSGVKFNMTPIGEVIQSSPGVKILMPGHLCENPFSCCFTETSEFNNVKTKMVVASSVGPGLSRCGSNSLCCQCRWGVLQNVAHPV